MPIGLRQWILFIPFLIVMTHQGCTRINFFNGPEVLSPQKMQIADLGNDGTYVGKLRILHEAHREAGSLFQCERRIQPPRMLISKNVIDWVVIRNTKEKCAEVDQVPVNSVVATGNPLVTNCEASSTSGFTHSIVGLNSLFDDASCAQTGTGNKLTAPLLGPLSNNGGPTETLSPLSGSPLIDAGDTMSWSNLDQWGFVRPVDQLGLGPRSDIGAVELQ